MTKYFLALQSTFTLELKFLPFPASLYTEHQHEIM